MSNDSSSGYGLSLTGNHTASIPTTVIGDTTGFYVKFTLKLSEGTVFDDSLNKLCYLRNSEGVNIYIALQLRSAQGARINLDMPVPGGGDYVLFGSSYFGKNENIEFLLNVDLVNKKLETSINGLIDRSQSITDADVAALSNYRVDTESSGIYGIDPPGSVIYRYADFNDVLYFKDENGGTGDVWTNINGTADSVIYPTPGDDSQWVYYNEGPIISNDQQHALIFDGNRTAYGPGFGKLLDRTSMRVEQDNVVIGNTSGYLWGQAGGPDSGKREVGLYVDSSDVRFILGGQISSLGTRAALFPDGIDVGTLVVSLEFSTGAVTLTADDVELFNGTVAVGSGWLSDMGFRIGARGTNATDSDNHSYILSANSHIGNTRVFVDGTLERDYRSDGTGDTWTDVASGQDLTISGGSGDETQWLEIGSAVSNSITLTTPTDYQFRQRVNDQGTFTVVGTYTGAPEGIELSTDGGATWSDATLAVADGQFTGDLTLSTGQYTVQYRFKNDPAIITAPVILGVGAVIAGAGHSNITGKGSKPQQFEPNGEYTAFRYLNANYFSILRDPWDSSVGQSGSDPSYDNSPGGSWVPNFANRWVRDNPSVPACYVASSLSGSGLDDWDKGTALYQRFIDRMDVFGGYEIVICGQGSVSSKDGSTYTDFYNQLDQFVNDVYADTGAAIYTMPMQNYTDGRATGDGVTGVDAIRQAIQDVCYSNAHVKPWVSLYDIDLTTSDGVHFMSDDQLTKQSDRIYEAVTQLGDTQTLINSPAATDGVYTLTVSDASGTQIVNEPVVIKSGMAATATLPVAEGEALTGQITNGTDTYTLSGPAGGQIKSPEVNNLPTANAGPDQTVESGAQVTLSATLSDEDEDDTLSGKWTVESAPDGVTVSMSDDTDPSMTFTAPVLDEQGDIILAFTPFDGEEYGTASMVTITVNQRVIESTATFTLENLADGEYTTRVYTAAGLEVFRGPQQWTEGQASFIVPADAGEAVELYLFDSEERIGAIELGVSE